MCDVPSIAVFCSESIECFPGTASKFILKLLVTIPVAPIIIGIIVLLLLLLLLLVLLTVLLSLLGLLNLQYTSQRFAVSPYFYP